jgi:hypothetical protein
MFVVYSLELEYTCNTMGWPYGFPLLVCFFSSGTHMGAITRLSQNPRGLVHVPSTTNFNGLYKPWRGCERVYHYTWWTTYVDHLGSETMYKIIFRILV